MACVHGLSGRRRFGGNLFSLRKWKHGTSSIESFVLLVARIRGDTRLIDAFARFSFQVQCIRRVLFRHLSSEAMKVELVERIAALDVEIAIFLVYTRFSVHCALVGLEPLRLSPFRSLMSKSSSFRF